MPWYRLEVFKTQDPLSHRRDILAPDDREAIRRADELYEGFGIGVPLDHYVLYDGDRVVHERVGSKWSPLG